MKAKKAYKKGGKVPPKGRKAGTPRPPQPVLGKSREERRAETDRQYTGKPKSEMVAPRRSSIGPKRVEKMEAGGRMEPIIGRPESKKLKKLTPIGVSKITTGETMAAASDKARKIKDPSLRKTVAEVEKPRRKKRRRKFDNGGKTKKDSVRTDTLERSVEQVYENARREEEERNAWKNNSGTTSGWPGVGRPLTTRQGAPEKIKPLGPKKIDSGVSMDKTLKRSSAKIAIPPAKKKRRLRRRK